MQNSSPLSTHNHLVVKVFALRVADPGFDSSLSHGDFSRWSHSSDLKLCIPVATLPGAWRYRVSAGTDWSGVNILWLGEIESLISDFYHSVAACADLSLRYTRILLGH